MASLSWVASVACQAPALSLDTPHSVSTSLPLGAGTTSHLNASCELQLLHVLGWQQAYNPSGYSISTKAPANLTVESWLSLRCLHSLTSLTLTGSVPSLPDAWATSTSFPVLRSLTLSASGLAGSLPASWSQPTAFQQLKTLNLSFTQLSGTLPASWAQPEAFPKLLELDLSATAIHGNQLLFCSACVLHARSCKLASHASSTTPYTFPGSFV